MDPKAAMAAKLASAWAKNATGRSQRERTLLLRLADAERQGRHAIAVDTITQLRAIPSMADLDDKLARRLGDLNIECLFSGEPVPWTSEVTVRHGQSVHRIAREHGTTVAAIRQLNGLSATEEPEAGRQLRVLEFPRAAFVVHMQTRHADLTLNGRLFKRYYVSVGKDTKPGAYPITSKANEGPRSRFSALGICVAAPDMKELDMFLAPGSSLTVSEM
jgi:LysM repeat protein